MPIFVWTLLKPLTPTDHLHLSTSCGSILFIQHFVFWALYPGYYSQYREYNNKNKTDKNLCLHGGSNDNCGSVWSGLHLSIWSEVILAFPNCASQTCSLSHFLKPTSLVPVWGSFYMLFPVLRMFFCPSLRVGRSFLVSFEVIPLMRLSLVI